MEVSYATMIAMGTLVQRLGRDARRLEKALAETMNASAEWRRIVDELKAERDAERKAHNEYKERNRELFNQNQRLTAELVVIKDERDALRAQLDTERKAKTIDVPQAHSVKVPDWVRRTAFEHGPNTKIGTVAKVVDVDIDGDYRVAINDTEVCWRPAHCTPCDPPEATHDTPAGKQAAESAVTDGIRAGDKVEVFQKTTDETLFDDISICGTVFEVFWSGTGTKCVRLIPKTMNRNSRGGATFGYDDVRKIAQKTAQAVEPKVGDTVRLVRKPTQEDYPNQPWSDLWGQVGQTDTVMYVLPGVVRVSSLWSWPISCIEIVEDAK